MVRRVPLQEHIQEGLEYDRRDCGKYGHAANSLTEVPFKVETWKNGGWRATVDRRELAEAMIYRDLSY